ncbi:transporter [Ganoderma sinense ZZ0214-1]|uniref:Transporter n=1 Tax=Ganoderma sinense ZZ0214-1 TaxID=1077348 RepID=A0A2G8SB35_9APHY|nr:transporter [Ganoderma sinense ZZ0214-1]
MPAAQLTKEQEQDGPSGDADHLISSTGYGKTSKELIDLMSQLRSLGAHTDIELPRIVVIGNQSAGKSSLVEAISVVNHGPARRRHLHEVSDGVSPFSLSRPWSCQIKIRWEFLDASRRRPEVEEVHFGPRILDKFKVELILRRAQAAVLNPSRPLSEFLQMDEKDQRLTTKENNQYQFSRNVVCVELMGPDLGDLSFVDLPGIVQNADDEVIKLVEDLVNSYIAGEKSVILVTLPMSDDIENQKAARLAKLADPRGSRTIGVLTKPDALGEGAIKARNRWLEVLEGRRHPLLHGYYCTRQPDDRERSWGISTAAARDEEAQFFKNAEPWATSPFQNRLGTPILVQNISRVLTQIIQTSLLKILNDIATLHLSCSKQLQTFPPPPITDDPGAFVLNLITRFCTDIEAHVRGSPEFARLVQANREAYEKFKARIRSTTPPPFVPYVSREDVPKDAAMHRDKKGSRTSNAQGDIYLRDLKEHVRPCITRELPGNVPYAAKRSLIHNFQQTWETITMSCFEEVQRVTQDVVIKLAHASLDRYGNLKASVCPVIMDQLELRAVETKRNLRIILKLEAAAPFTQNTHYLAEKRDKHLAQYKDARAGRTSAERPTIATTSAPEASSTPGESANRSNTMTFPANHHYFSNIFPPPGEPTIFGTPSREHTPATAALASASDQSPAPVAHGKARHRAKRLETKSPFSTTVTETPSSPFAPQASSAQAVPAASTTSVPSLSSSQIASFFQSNATQTGAWAEQTSASFAAPSQAHVSETDTATRTKPQRNEQAIREALAALTKLSLNVTEEDLGKLNPPDEYEDELVLMAEVRAYFDVAYKRIIDYIPLSIDEHFLYAFVESLQPVLFEKLGLGSANSHARCLSYLAEDPQVVALRDELLTKKKRLESVQKALINFGL